MAARKSKKNRTPQGKSPKRPLPARYGLGFAVVVAVIVMFPLFAVWRQVYITNSSLKQQDLADSAAVLAERFTQLRISAERLASTERIERIARESLQLEYPASEQIVVVRPPEKVQRSSMFDWGFLAVLRRSLEQERG